MILAEVSLIGWPPRDLGVSKQCWEHNFEIVPRLTPVAWWIECPETPDWSIVMMWSQVAGLRDFMMNNMRKWWKSTCIYILKWTNHMTLLIVMVNQQSHMTIAICRVYFWRKILGNKTVHMWLLYSSCDYIAIYGHMMSSLYPHYNMILEHVL